MSVAKSDDLRALPPKAPPETSATPTMIHRTDQATPESTVSLVGVVRLTATPSAPATQSLVGAPSCFSRHPEGRPDDSLLVEDDLGLQNAVVWVLLGTPPAREAVSRPDSISFEDCRFHPRVVALVPEQSLRCRNDDDLRHDLLGGTEGPTPLEPGQSIRMRWSGPCDPLPQSCRLHPWEVGWVIVLPTRFHDVTGLGGKFRIDGIPPGEHGIVVWHERCKEFRRTLDVSEAGLRMVDIILPTPR